MMDFKIICACIIDDSTRSDVSRFVVCLRFVTTKYESHFNFIIIEFIFIQLTKIGVKARKRKGNFMGFYQCFLLLYFVKK